MIELGSSLPTLRTPRLAIRPLAPADVPALFAIFSDAEVTRYWSSPAMQSIDEAEALLAAIHECFRERTLFQWGLARLEDDLVIGTCTLGALQWKHRRGELGFALGRGFWRQGYVREALPAVVRFAFLNLDLCRLEADVDPRNMASLHVIEALGFRREGYLRERYHVNGEVQDAAFYGLLRDECDLLPRPPERIV